ncbi:hypothetical protein ACFQGW_09940 [Xanthomonas theicola]|uniref:hypothetical protein n=1 Tax=Xanthomonas theicola TaxID=56464 RepID=UPI0011B06DE8
MFLSGRHGISLNDCDDPKIMISAQLSDEVMASPKGKELLRLGYSQWPPGHEMKIEVNVSGVVKSISTNRQGEDFIVTKVNSIRSDDL